MMNKEGRTSVEDVFRSFEIVSEEGPVGQVMEVHRQPGAANVQIQRGSDLHNLQVYIFAQEFVIGFKHLPRMWIQMQ